MVFHGFPPLLHPKIGGKIERRRRPKKPMEHVSFVILHYLDYDTTIQCIKSIQENIAYENYSIILVDNNSPDGSGLRLQEHFADVEQVVVILSNENLGFARGNNLGFRYAKEHYHSQYIIIANNDTLFSQETFISEIVRIYQDTHCAVMGPNIVTLQGYHQSPLRDHVYHKKEVLQKIFVKSIYLYYFKFKKIFHLDSKIQILEYLFEKRDEHNQSLKKWNIDLENVVLHGACIIYTPTYIQQEENAFLPCTFMYGEEDLLAFLCQKKGYKSFYSPRLTVTHLDGNATKLAYTSIDKKIFTYKYIVEGWKTLLRVMGEENK